MRRFIKYVVLPLVVIFCFVIICYFHFPGIIVKTQIAFARWNADVEWQKVEVVKHQWTYLEGGTENKDTIVFIHGFGMSKDRWIPMLSYFGKKYHVIAPDIPGFGENIIVEGETYNAATMVKLLNAFLEAIKVSDFHMIGVSMGGGISGCYAGVYPKKVKKLVLMDAAGIKAPVLSPFWKLYKETGENLMLWDTPEEFKKLIKNVFHKPPKFPDHFIEYFVEQKVKRLPMEKKVFSAMVKDGHNVLGERLSLIKARTLILWGDKDRIIDVSTVKVLENKLANSKTVIFKDVGHVPYLEVPDKTYQACDKFLSNS